MVIDLTHLSSSLKTSFWVHKPKWLKGLIGYISSYLVSKFLASYLKAFQRSDIVNWYCHSLLSSQNYTIFWSKMSIFWHYFSKISLGKHAPDPHRWRESPRVAMLSAPTFQPSTAYVHHLITSAWLNYIQL